MSRARTCSQIPSGGCWRIAILALPALLLATPGCVSMQNQARRESMERWNRVRAQVKAKLASDQLTAGHVEDAATELAEAFRLDPTSPELLMLQARIYLARGDPAAAERLLENTEVEGEARAEIEYLRGIVAEQRLHWDEALNHFVRAANENTREVAYIVAVVQNLLQFGEAQEALTFLRSCEAEFGWTGAYHAAVAECCEQLEDWAGAASAWQKALDPSDDPGIRERLATALYRAGRWSEALRHFEQLLSEDRTQPSAPLRLALAECLIEDGQPAAAHEQASLVLRSAPRNVTALQILAHVCIEQGQFERARQTAEQALRLAPDNCGTLELAATLAFRTGDQTRALVLAQRIQRSFPEADSPVARHIIACLTGAHTTSEK